MSSSAAEQAAWGVLNACEHGIYGEVWFDDHVRRFRHGDNPEAVLDVPERDVMRLPSFAQPVAAWVERIHAYEAVPSQEETNR